MPRTHSHYPPEFRQQIVELVQAGHTPNKLTLGFDPAAESIRNWVKQAEIDAGQRQDGLTTADKRELTRLQRENKQLRMEWEIVGLSRKVSSKWIKAVEMAKNKKIVPLDNRQLDESVGQG